MTSTADRTITSTTELGSDQQDGVFHECEVEDPSREADAGRARSNRFVGVDAARGLALLGMLAVHTISPATSDGDTTLAWLLASGKASALFAVLAGVSLGFMTGRVVPPRGLQWLRAARIPIIRGLLIVAIGLLAGAVVSADFIVIILPYLGVMFVLTAFLLPLRPHVLIPLGLVWALASPVLSHTLRSGSPIWGETNVTFTTLWNSPGETLSTLLLTGGFPVLTWMAYICIGLGLGRSDLTSRAVVVRIIAGGAALTIATALITQLFLALGLLDRLGGDVQGHTSLEEFTDLVVWGANGTLPTDSRWWLALNAPHTATPLDLLFTAGIALLTIGILLALSIAIAPVLHVLAAPGSMTLTIYTGHALLLPVLADLPEVAHFGLQVMIAVIFAIAWKSQFSKGPLEWAVWAITSAATMSRGPKRLQHIPRHRAG